jgi:hypothetical protein
MASASRARLRYVNGPAWAKDGASAPALAGGRQDDGGHPKQPLVTIIERRIDSDRNTSNVYVLHVPWARRGDIDRDLEELRHLPASATMSLQRVGVVHDPTTTGKGNT